MKWIVGLLLLAFVGGFYWYESGSVKSSYVNGLPEYRSLPNRQYILEQDCYIFKLLGHNTDWPLVGTHDQVPDLPAEVSARNVGATFAGVRIIDVARVGSQFKLMSVRRDEARRGTTITFEILFADEADRMYPRLDAYYLLDHTPEAGGRPPTFLERAVVPRPVK